MHEEQYLEVGQIVNTVGIKGEVKVLPLTDNPKRFDDLKNIFVDIKGNLEEAIISKVRYQKNVVILTLKGIDSIEKALKYKGYYIKINREDAVALEDDEYFISDLIGLKVYKSNNNYLGIIDDVFPTGSNDVYVVKNEGKQILLPAISQVIKSVDIPNGKMTVELLRGMEDEV